MWKMCVSVWHCLMIYCRHTCALWISKQNPEDSTILTDLKGSGSQQNIGGMKDVCSMCWVVVRVCWQVVVLWCKRRGEERERERGRDYTKGDKLKSMHCISKENGFHTSMAVTKLTKSFFDILNSMNSPRCYKMTRHISINFTPGWHICGKNSQRK